MRALAKALIMSMVLCSTVSTLQTAAKATAPLAAVNFVTDAGIPTQTWKFFRSSFNAGDTIQVAWKGAAHLKLTVWDRSTGQPVLDDNDQPVSALFTGSTWAFSSNVMTLKVPVDVDDAMLVVKNVDASSGIAMFYIYSNDPMSLAVSPTIYIPWPSVARNADGTATAYFYALNLGTVTAFHVNTRLLAQTASSSTMVVGDEGGLNDATVQPGVLTTSSLNIPARTSVFCIQVTNVTYGETTTTNFNFCLQ